GRAAGGMVRPGRRRWPAWVGATALLAAAAALAGYALSRRDGGAVPTQPAPAAVLSTRPAEPGPGGVGPTQREPAPGAGEVLRLDGHSGIVDCVAFLPEGPRALSGSWDGTVRLWNLDTGREVRRVGEQSAAVHCLAVSADGRHVLAAGGTQPDARP